LSGRRNWSIITVSGVPLGGVNETFRQPGGFFFKALKIALFPDLKRQGVNKNAHIFSYMLRFLFPPFLDFRKKQLLFRGSLTVVLSRLIEASPRGFR